MRDPKAVPPRARRGACNLTGLLRLHVGPFHHGRDARGADELRCGTCGKTLDPPRSLQAVRHASPTAGGGLTKPAKGDQTRTELHSPTQPRRLVIECQDDATLDAVYNIVNRIHGVNATLSGKEGGLT